MCTGPDHRMCEMDERGWHKPTPEARSQWVCKHCGTVYKYSPSTSKNKTQFDDAPSVEYVKELETQIVLLHTIIGRLKGPIKYWARAINPKWWTDAEWAAIQASKPVEGLKAKRIDL